MSKNQSEFVCKYGRYVLRAGVPLRGGTLTVRPPRITMECEDFILNSFPARIINPRGFETRCDYDTRGNLTRYVDPRGTATDIEVNALNQRIGRQTQGATFGERVRAVFHYDALKRPVQITQEISPTGQPGVLTNRFIYDANDNLVLHRLPEACDGSEPDNVIAYAYDERGLLLSKARAPGTGLSALYSYDYDGNGNLTRFTQSETLATTYSERVYDGFDRCVKTIDPMGNVATFRYDASGNRIYTKVEGELIDLPGGALNRRFPARQDREGQANA